MIVVLKLGHCTTIKQVKIIQDSPQSTHAGCHVTCLNYLDKIQCTTIGTGLSVCVGGGGGFLACRHMQ